MIYQFESRVRYSEVDRHQNLTLNAIINYFQDCSTFHSEHIGLGLSYMEEHQKAWVLSSWQIVIHRNLKFGEPITVQTWPYDFKGFMGSRNFALLDEEGKRVVSANSLWSFLDAGTGRPVKVAPEQIRGYVLEEKLPMKYAPRKIALPKQMEEMGQITVQNHHLDTNNHVNNGQYVQMAYEFLPEQFVLRQMRAEYKKQAKLHDHLVPWVKLEEKSCTVVLCGEDRTPYAVVSFEE
ncbi:MAG: thioesterase [Lachnospiraceae bacterium]|jgi:medium-chain acyl-[acyl-carrier-protein] hydrolase|nr:thioesterase [Lachnospiraceae bacterium]